MGITTDSKRFPAIMALLFIAILLLSVEQSSGGLVKSSQLVNKNFCRNHIFSPHCRGQQKREVNHEEYRFPVLEDLSINEKSQILNNFLRKMLEAPPEYDTDLNYLK